MNTGAIGAIFIAMSILRLPIAAIERHFGGARFQAAHGDNLFLRMILAAPGNCRTLKIAFTSGKSDSGVSGQQTNDRKAG